LDFREKSPVIRELPSDHTLLFSRFAWGKLAQLCKTGSFLDAFREKPRWRDAGAVERVRCYDSFLGFVGHSLSLLSRDDTEENMRSVRHGSG